MVFGIGRQAPGGGDRPFVRPYEDETVKSSIGVSRKKQVADS